MEPNHTSSSSKGDHSGPSNPTTPKAVYVSVSVEPCNSTETRQYWAERAARAKAGLANPSVHVHHASSEFDKGLVNAILAGKGELVATTVNGVREDNVSPLSGANDDGTVVHHDVSDDNSATSPAADTRQGYHLNQSVSSGSVLRSSDPFVDKQIKRASSQQAAHQHQETARYHVPMDSNIVPQQPPAPSPTNGSSDEHDIFIGGEPGPDVGRRYRANSEVCRSSSPMGAPDNYQNAHPSASRPSYSICTISGNRSRAASSSSSHHRRPSDVRQQSSASSLRSRFSSRNFTGTTVTSATDNQDRPIVVTNALHHILYDGSCDHCVPNHCACLAPEDSPGLPPAVDAPGGGNNNNNNSRIATEGFCRHCVLNRCSCITGDPRWGLRHASLTLHQTKQRQHQQRQHKSVGQEDTGEQQQQSLRIVSDAGTVRRYATGQEEHDDSATSSEGQMATTTTTTTTRAPMPRTSTPPPAYRAPYHHPGINNNDNSNEEDTSNNIAHPIGDVEAQQHQQQQQQQQRRSIWLWRVRCHHSHVDESPDSTMRNPVLRFYWLLTASVAAALIIFGVWYYANRSSHALTTPEEQKYAGPY